MRAAAIQIAPQRSAQRQPSLEGLEGFSSAERIAQGQVRPLIIGRTETVKHVDPAAEQRADEKRRGTAINDGEQAGCDRAEAYQDR
jgi:hypothetical protein